MNRRIAFHFTDLSSGGVEKMRLALSRELLDQGYDVDLVLCRAAGPYLDQVPPGARLIDLHAKRARNALFPLVRYLREEKPEVLISSMGMPNIISITAGMLSGTRTPIFVTQHNALSKQAHQMRDAQQSMVPHLYKFTLPLARGVFAVSAGVADDLSSMTGFPRDKITVLYNPAYPENLEARLAEPFQDPFFNEQPVVTAVGRLTEQKGFDILISAMAMVNRTRPVRLAILGVGPLLDSFTAQVNELGLQDQVKFYGYQTNPLSFMSNSKAVAMSSRYEGFGNVLVEALACGTQVVSTDCESGPAEILDGGRFGRLVPVDDAGAIAQAIIEAIDHPIDPSTLRSRARQYSPQVITQRYIQAVFGEQAR